ncbi:MAG: 16S rRNA (adenine(1518)-N(6)/adenine(1519)-N(6))-dimethyltransferase [Gammaproteobacteria bacterium]|nr:16S rRNA (adenine(1518)-N(6)/adenine(1519)-N(6))-dimethyltransferase [Gammaproteobacteria bacterium]
MPDHRARKRFGQNFLQDDNIIRRIVAAINPKQGEHIVEIGPGQGAITTPLLASGARLDAIELDRDLAAWLQSRFADVETFTLHQADVLKFDLASLATASRSLSIVGNLPYNISTPCIFHLLKYQSLIHEMTFMLQLEVVQRLAAQVGDDNYGRLGIMAQYYCQVDHLFDVPPGAFHPQPKVTSAIVRLTPHREQKLIATDTTMLQDVVRTAFSQRRKTLRNCLKGLITDMNPEDLPVDLSLRPENLSLADYVNLSNTLSAARQEL